MKLSIAAILFTAHLGFCAGYNAVELPVLPATSSAYIGGVADGWVTGAVFIGDWANDYTHGYYQAVAWHNGTIVALPTPAGLSSSAEIVNNSGTIAGGISPLISTTKVSGIWTHDSFASLPVPGMADGFYGQVNAINDAGIIAGYVISSTQLLPNGSAAISIPALWSGGQVRLLTDFPTLSASASAINNLGRAVIRGYDGSRSRSFTYDDGNIVPIPGLTGNAGDSSVIGLGINGAGTVVGSSLAADGHFHAFLYDGAAHDLGFVAGSFATEAFAINDDGTILGRAFFLDGEIRGVLWDKELHMFDLDDLLPSDSGWALDFPTGLADDGSIAGYGRFHGQSALFLLTSSTQSSTAVVVPEPASVSWLAPLAGMLIRLGKRRR